MAASRAIFSAVAIVWVFLARVECQSITVTPSSIGATTGDQNILIQCSASNWGTNAVVWLYNPSWSNADVVIFSSYYNQTGDTANFSVNSYVQGSVYHADLTIKTAKPGQASTYTCELQPALLTKGTSSFVVLDPMECPNTYVEYNPGDVANMSCSVNYTGASQMPDLTWSLNGANLGGVYTESTSTRRTLTLYRPVTDQDDNQEFMCTVSFPSNNPPYANNCTTVLYVMYPTSEVFIFPVSSADNPVTIPVGEAINCTADGRPEPTITWNDDQMNKLQDGGELIVSDAMLGWSQPVTLLCIANNTDGEAIGNYTFIVGAAVVAVQTGGVEPWVIAVAVVVPIVVIAIIAIIVFFVVRHRKKKQQTKKPKPSNGSTIVRPNATTTSTAYTPVSTTEYGSPSRPPPSSAPRTGGTGSLSSGPPGPDNRNGAIGGGESPGYGDLGVQGPTRGSLHGSNPALGVGISMNPNPGYPVRGSNQAINLSMSSNQRPAYPYSGSNPALNTSLNQNPTGVPGGSYGRQPSIASSTDRSHASSYNAGIPAMGGNRYPPNDLSSMHGSEV